MSVSHHDSPQTRVGSFGQASCFVSASGRALQIVTSERPIGLSVVSLCEHRLALHS